MIKVVVLTLLLAGCGLFGGGSKPSITTGDNAQVQQATAGSTGSAEQIESITTVNEQGIDLQMLLAIMGGTLVFGLVMGVLMPQPRFIRGLF